MIGIAPFTPQAFHTVGSGLFASFRSVAYPRWSLHEPLKPSAGCQRWTVAKRGSWCVANPDLLREDGQKDHALSRVAQVTRWSFIIPSKSLGLNLPVCWRSFQVAINL